jgi:LysM repeat protein
VETEQAKGRIWNGYVCPGCRNVFRVAADFAGDEVMCPSCQETLRLPKKPGDAPPFSAPAQPTQPAPDARIDENQIHENAAEPLWRNLLTSPGGRKKLSLALGIPLLLVAVVLMLLPADESPSAQASTSPPSDPVATESAEAPAPPPDTDASQIAYLAPEVLENEALPEPPPPAIPREADPALVAEVSDEPETIEPAVQVPAPVDPDHGLVQAIPADSPVAQPPVETPAATGATDDSPVTIHTVVRGDTLGKISSTYGVPIDVIREANQLKNDTVQVGQQLRVPGATLQAPAEPPVTESTSPPATRHHTVVRGDTLSRIARKYEVDAKAIMRANGMKNDIVRLGAKLVIPPADP